MLDRLRALANSLPADASDGNVTKFIADAAEFVSLFKDLDYWLSQRGAPLPTFWQEARRVWPVEPVRPQPDENS